MSEVLRRLKDTTKHLHDQLEVVSFSREMMSQQITQPQYLAVLQNNQQVYAALEPMLNAVIKGKGEKSFTPFISHRLADLQKDLSYFPTENNSFNNTLTLPLSIDSPARLIGTLYVLEGARLGGKVIVKALQKNEALSDLSAFHFYEQNGIDTRKRWMAFRELAERIIGENEEWLEEAGIAAKEVFSFFMPSRK